MWVFDHIENIHTLSRGKRFYEKVLWFFKRTRKKYNCFFLKELSLREEELKSHQDGKICFICGERTLKEAL